MRIVRTGDAGRIGARQCVGRTARGLANRDATWPSPGATEAWDDFAITGASILKAGESMTMFYPGVALSSDERTSAIGIARSSDGMTWTTHDDNSRARARSRHR